MLSEEELQHIVLAKQNGWAEFYPVGRDAEMAEELLSLREQLAELKALEPLGYIDPRTLADDGCSGGTWMKQQPREIGPYTMPIFTAAKPVEGSEIAKFMAGVKNSMAQEVAEAIQKEALLIMFDEITPDTETVAMQYESLVKRINCPED